MLPSGVMKGLERTVYGKPHIRRQRWKSCFRIFQLFLTKWSDSQTKKVNTSFDCGSATVKKEGVEDLLWAMTMLPELRTFFCSYFFQDWRRKKPENLPSGVVKSGGEFGVREAGGRIFAGRPHWHRTGGVLCFSDPTACTGVVSLRRRGPFSMLPFTIR